MQKCRHQHGLGVIHLCHNGSDRDRVSDVRLVGILATLPDGFMSGRGELVSPFHAEGDSGNHDLRRPSDRLALKLGDLPGVKRDVPGVLGRLIFLHLLRDVLSLPLRQHARCEHGFRPEMTGQG